MNVANITNMTLMHTPISELYGKANSASSSTSQLVFDHLRMILKKSTFFLQDCFKILRTLLSVHAHWLVSPFCFSLLSVFSLPAVICFFDSSISEYKVAQKTDQDACGRSLLIMKPIKTKVHRTTSQQQVHLQVCAKQWHNYTNSSKARINSTYMSTSNLRVCT